ncbi:iron complex transport system substrate-binding protein [Aeromicrobium sp. SORGH_AS981]|uniref:ABC transporter substrate-binding protein n=1 Tax=Aeromicrobium sp. SORGH_AS_0981 TaxID=3041802 RepID=UPI00285EC4AF|nr:ABC transporter substrate-binding protein [Aeromicrobium sp. SORGH_AS_0981]MDR6117376.1 iron complex transport system substrate-binding protein [Aeromicrobium sp. SORGH_AS_0981]
MPSPVGARLRRPAALLATLCLTAPLAACGSPSSRPANDAAATAGFPVTVENCGHDVTEAAPPQRIVAINQPATELLLSLGLADRMAGYGVSDHDFLPGLEAQARRTKALDAEFPGFEAMLSLEPDLVYATFAYAFTGEGVAPRAKFDEVGIPTYQSPSECGGQDAPHEEPLTLDDLYAEIGDVSRLTGVEERGEQLVAELRERARTVTVDLDADDVTLGWWYASTKSPYMAGCCGAPGLMTRAVGATNAFGDNERLWPETSWESILDADPTVLVLADLERGGDGDSAEAKIRFLESDPVARQLTAVKKRRYVVLGGTTMDPSIRNVDGIEQLAQGLRDLGVVPDGR